MLVRSDQHQEKFKLDLGKNTPGPGDEAFSPWENGFLTPWENVCILGHDLGKVQRGKMVPRLGKMVTHTGNTASHLGKPGESSTPFPSFPRRCPGADDRRSCANAVTDWHQQSCIIETALSCAVHGSRSKGFHTFCSHF